MRCVLASRVGFWPQLHHTVLNPDIFKMCCCSNVTFDFEKSIFFVLLLLFIFSTSYCCRLILASASSYLRELVEISDETVLLVPHVSRDTILNLRNLLYSGNTQKVYTGVKCKHRVQICNDGFHKTLYLKNRHQKGKS